MCGLREEEAHLKKGWTAWAEADGMGIFFVSCCNHVTCFANIYSTLLCVCTVRIKMLKNKQFYEPHKNLF